MKSVPIEKVSAYLESARSKTIDDELLELSALVRSTTAAGSFETGAIYQQIKRNVLKEIRFRELALTFIIRDLRDIRANRPRHLAVIEEFVVRNDLSYAQIAEVFGISKQRVFAIVSNESVRFPWLKSLMEIKAAEGARNENNRSVFFKPANRRRGVFEKPHQDELPL